MTIEVVDARKHDPVTDFAELTEYVATDRIKAEYERLFAAMAAAANSPSKCIGVWVSGFYGSGKSSFAKNLGYVLANREVLGASASSIFLQQVDSPRISEYVEFLNRTAPCEIFMLDAQLDLPHQANADQIAKIMYSIALRDLDYAEGHDGSSLSVRDLVEKLFNVCEIRRPGKTFAFILDEMDQYLALGGEHLKSLRIVVEQFGKVSIQREKARKIPGPVWIIVTAQQKLHGIDNCDKVRRADVIKLQELFKHQIDLSTAGIAEIAARSVLRKKESKQSALRELFREHGASLIRNVNLEGCSRRTEFDEDQFVEFYPYLPHLIDLSIDIAIRLHSTAPKHPLSANLNLVSQCFAMLTSEQTRLADQELGVLVSVDKIYELVAGSIPVSKQDDIQIIGEHCDLGEYPGMAARVAKAICLMEYVKAELPRTPKNVAALLVQHVAEAPPTFAVTTVLNRMKCADFVRETEDGWKLYDFDELHRAATALEELRQTLGKVNPRLPGWQNNLIQLIKKLLARILNWYTQPWHAFNASASQLLQEIAGHLDDLSIHMLVLETQLAQPEKKKAALQDQFPSLIETRPGKSRTAYVVGLYGTGRLYVYELMQHNIGERAKYLRHTIRFHPCPTRMIYGGHTTIKYVSRGQAWPTVTSRILGAIRAGFADLIFVYRHPLDSLLTNWVWWRTHLRDYAYVSGISQVYRNREDLCADLDQNFLEFKAFADGDPDFFSHAEPGPRFLSFSEFVEETELFIQSATLTLRLEDFMSDPLKEFSKIAEVMSVNVDLSRLDLTRPRTKPYGYLAVREKVPRFRDFIDGLNAETKKRIDRIGYKL